MRPSANLVIALVGAALQLAAPASARAASTECSPTPDLTSVPALTDVCNGNSPVPNPLTAFDRLAWRTFLRLIWPASTTMRGQPDQNATLTDAIAHPDRILTFETFKPTWEVFRDRAATPEAWGNWPTSAEPCVNHPRIKPGELVLASLNELTIRQPDNPKTSANALVAQNGTFVRYLAALNEAEFNVITNHRLYDSGIVEQLGPLSANSPALAPDGSLNADEAAITIKTAWVEFHDNDPAAHHIDPSRFFWRSAWVQDPNDRTCRQTKVALVGMHIVHKTKSRPQWIWATFEQIDNAPCDNLPPVISLRPKHLTFSDGTCFHPMGNTPYSDWLFPTPTPTPHNIIRDQVIEDETKSINADWRKAFSSLDRRSVWQYYRLVMVQWPGKAQADFHPAADARPTPPCAGITNSATANLTMETFFQNAGTCVQPRATCMTCHDLAHNADFVFAIPMEARSSTPIEPFVRSQTQKAIEELIAGSRGSNSRKD